MPLLLIVGLSAAEAMARGAAVKPWDREEPCGWWLIGKDGRSPQAAINQGETGVVLTLAHPAFASWSEAERPRVELLFDADPGRRVAGEARTTHDIKGRGSVAIELQREQLAAMAEATGVELRRDGKTVMTLPLADSPVLDELTACIRAPSEHSGTE